MRLLLLLCTAIFPLVWAGAGYGQLPRPVLPIEGVSASPSPSGYILGPGDQITVLASNIDEISKAYRIDSSGNVNPPIVGRTHAAGSTPEQLEHLFVARLKTYYTDPAISISVTEYRSQPVSLLGAVTKPDVYQVQGSRTLFELISLAGGLRADAGNRVQVSRRSDRGILPLPGATYDQTRQFMAGEIPVKAILDGKHPIYNIQVQPDDVITVPRAEMVYVVGSVNKAGGYIMSDSDSMTVMQALALAAGFARAAAGQHAKILRVTAGSTMRQEIPVNLKKVAEGKDGDVPLRAEDILFVPSSATQNAALRTFEAAIQVGTGLAIYRP
jgi:polysaccharide export outer membrane protein